jgi:dephospho-CoA kinase
MLIGVTGTDGSGKGTVVNYLTEYKGCTHYSARAIWMEEFKRRGTEPSRANMRLVANELRKEHGNDFVVTHYLKQIEQNTPACAIIESIRAVAEAETLKAHGGVLIAVDADQHIRYGRVQARRSESDQVSFEEFKAHEELESNDPDPHGMQKRKVIAMADYTIFNNGTFEALAQEIESIWNKITEKTSG